MRENKYRGKSFNYDCWLYGSYLHIPKIFGSKIEHHFITSWISNIPSDMVSTRVKGETVGQYIGINDINGKEIYEGDIVKNNEGEIGYIAWLEEVCAFGVIFNNHSHQLARDTNFDDNRTCLEVIGNIYDNPELLKEIKI